jgi:hypothetical protein
MRRASNNVGADHTLCGRPVRRLAMLRVLHGMRAATLALALLMLAGLLAGALHYFDVLMP